MGSAENEWRPVKRRKNIRSYDLTSFYVGNLPDDVSIGKLKSLFIDYGEVVDVYIARKKDSSGLNFGFVKFRGVKDATKLEESFNRMQLDNNILAVNIARYQRRSLVLQDQPRSSIRQSVHNPPPPSAWNLKGTKSFANVVSGVTVSGKKTPLRINLKPSSEIDKTLFSSFLFGESTDLETLKAIPSLLKDAGIMYKKIFYYGGLCTLIGFDAEKDASGFLENVECWKDWFTWLKRGDSTINWNFKRVVDVKIIGLPTLFRTLDNFQVIISHLGKIVDMEDYNVWKFKDLSYVKIRLLTESKTKINEEIIIEYGNGKHIRIGVVEDACFSNPLADYDTVDKENLMEVDQSSSDDDCEVERVSDTFSVISAKRNIDTIHEDGEIVPDDDIGNSPTNLNEEHVFKHSGAAINILINGNRMVEIEVPTKENGGDIINAKHDRIDSTKENINTIGSHDSNSLEDVGQCKTHEVSNSKSGAQHMVLEKDDDEEGELNHTVNSHATVNSAPPILVPWDPSTLDGSWFNFGTLLASTRKKRRRFSPTKQAHFAGSSDPSGVPSNAPVSSIDLNRNINPGDGASNGC